MGILNLHIFREFCKDNSNNSSGKTSSPKRKKIRPSVLQPIQEPLFRKCDQCQEFSFDLPRHMLEAHNITGEKLVASINAATLFSPYSQLDGNFELPELDLQIVTGPKTPDGKRFCISPKRYEKFCTFSFRKMF